MAAMFRIRAATASDAPAIAHVHVESWRTTYRGIVPEEALAALDEESRAQDWVEWLTRDVSVLVAEQNGAVTGFVAGGPAREPEPGYDAELYALYLLESAQRQGTGRALVAALAQALLVHSHNGLLLWVLEANPAVGFYTAMGGVRLHSKQMEMGGASLPEVAFGWRDLRTLTEK